MVSSQSLYCSSRFSTIIVVQIFSIYLRLATMGTFLGTLRKLGFFLSMLSRYSCGFSTLCFCLLMAFSTLTPASLSNHLLSAERAFSISTKRYGKELIVTLNIADGYYVYRERLAFHSDPSDLLGKTDLPDGHIKQDAYFGAQRVLTGHNVITIPLRSNPPEHFKLTVRIQGCALAKVCYPPFIRIFNIGPHANLFTLTETENKAKSRTPLLEQTRQNDMITGNVSPQFLLGTDNIALTLFTFLISGLGIAFTACLYPLLPIVSSLIIGQSHRLTRTRGLILSLAYVQGLAVTYTVIGTIAGLTGSLFTVWLQQPAVLLTAGLLMVILALSMFDLFTLQLPPAWQARVSTMANRLTGKNIITVFIMGMISALIIGPCVAPPLALALGYIGSTGNALLGGAALYCMAVGMGLPLLLVGTVGGHVLPRSGAWMNTIKALFGVLMLGVAIRFVSPVLPAHITLLSWAILCIGSSVFLHATDSLMPDASRGRRLSKGLGIVLLLIGSAQLIGALAGNHNPLQPLQGLFGSTQENPLTVSFQPIRSLTELNQALLQAKGRPVLLDFYATWCLSCREIDQTTFADEGVMKALQKFVLLRVDMTQHNDVYTQLLNHFGLFGPPALLVFNSQGIKTDSIVGYINAKTLLTKLAPFLGDESRSVSNTPMNNTDN